MSSYFPRTPVLVLLQISHIPWEYNIIVERRKFYQAPKKHTDLTRIPVLSCNNINLPSHSNNTSARSPHPQLSQRVLLSSSSSTSTCSGISGRAFCLHFSLAISLPPILLKMIIALKGFLSSGHVLVWNKEKNICCYKLLIFKIIQSRSIVSQKIEKSPGHKTHETVCL